MQPQLQHQLQLPLHYIALPTTPHDTALHYTYTYTYNYDYSHHCTTATATTNAQSGGGSFIDR